MINQTIDYALVGHNYLTFILSIGLMERGKKVLLIDDDRFNYGDFFTNSITQIDLSCIKTLGLKINSIPLSDIENYTKPVDKVFYLGKKQILLGRTPGENLMELCRKFPEYFKCPTGFNFDQKSLESFNNQFYDICSTISSKIINNEKKIKLLNIFNESFNTELKFFFDQFIQAIEQKDQENEEFKSELITLIYLTRGFYQSHFATTGSKVELGHVLLCLLSPYYHLSHQELLKNLLTDFKAKGGEFKKLNLGDLKFNRSLVKGMELNNYEGFIKPGKIIFIGGHPLNLAIKFERPKNIYNCLSAVIKSSNIPKFLIGKNIVFSSSLKLSTNRPMFEAEFFEDQIKMNVVVMKKNGVKVDFIKSQVLKELASDFNYLFNDINLDLTDCEMHFTHDIFIEEMHKKNMIKKEFKLKNKLNDLIFWLDPLIYKRPTNVLYLGPYNDGFLGTLSSLIEINRWQEKI